MAIRSFLVGHDVRFRNMFLCRNADYFVVTFTLCTLGLARRYNGGSTGLRVIISFRMDLPFFLRRFRRVL